MELNNLTIIIPTHYRHAYLTRILGYYSSINVTVLVADSSIEPYSGEVPENTNYHHYSDGAYLEKMSDIIAKVKTKYTVICADDDFISRKAMGKCIKFLEANHDYSSAQGRYISFRTTKYGIQLSPCYLDRKHVDINGETSRERIVQEFEEYMHTIYSVHATECLQLALSLARSSRLVSGNIIELLIAFVSVIHGKHKVLPLFYCAREINSGVIGVDRVSLKDVVSNPNYADEYQRFVDALTSLIEQVEKVGRQEARQQVLDGIDAYLKEFIPWKKSREARKGYGIMLRGAVKVFIPQEFIDFLKARKLIQKYLNRNIRNTRGERGYPFYDNIAKSEWKEMKYYIKNHIISDNAA